MALLLLGLATLLAYSNSFDVPFLFDDGPAITENPAIRQLSGPTSGPATLQSGGVTTSGRPVLQLSLALNYAISGLEAWSYHALNLLIHLGSGCLLFSLIRRTVHVHRPGVSTSGLTEAVFALACAALWLLHPLQTSAVTYIIQRAESLAAFFYLLTLYGVARGARGSSRWFVLANVACWLGMATKETMVSAPVVAALFDRVFLAKSWSELWLRRRWVHLVNATSWLLLIALVVGTGGRGGTAGFSVDVSPWQYLLTQAEAIAHYLRLVFWPTPLVFDYGTPVVTSLLSVLPQLCLLVGLLVASVFALRRRPALGFLGLAFFALLAPSSSFVPVATQTMAEHRFYLPLATVIVAVALGLQRLLGRGAVVLVLALAVLAVPATRHRNEDYQSEEQIWRDTAEKQPGNARAHHNLGRALFANGAFAEALISYERALARGPASPETHYNAGLALARLERWEEAERHYTECLRLDPNHPEALNNLGNLWLARRQPARAREFYERALRVQPQLAEAHANLSEALLQLGDRANAELQAREALRLSPNEAEFHFKLANTLAAFRRWTEARAAFEAALTRSPQHPGALNNLANVLLELDQPEEAIRHFEAAVTVQPDLVPARRALVAMLPHFGQLDRALSHAEAWVQARPDDPEARAALAQLRGKSGTRLPPPR